MSMTSKRLNPLLVCVSVFILMYLIWFVLFSKKHALQKEILDPHTKRIEQLSSEFFDLQTQMITAETQRNESEYVKLAELIAQKDIEIDNENSGFLKELEKNNNGDKAEINQLLAEDGFSEEEKLKMLSTQYNLPLETARIFKKQIEIMFEDQLRDKYEDVSHEDIDYEPDRY